MFEFKKKKIQKKLHVMSKFMEHVVRLVFVFPFDDDNNKIFVYFMTIQ